MLAIKRIVEVTDTRQWKEGADDKFHPIPGSGTTNQCERCGRNHEIHARVELTDGSVATVGTGCMKADAFDKKLRSAATTAKTIARLHAELAAAVAHEAARAVAREAAAALYAPDVVISTMDVPVGWFETRCGSEAVFSPSRERAVERESEAVVAFRLAVAVKLCPPKSLSVWTTAKKLKAVEARAAK